MLRTALRTDAIPDNLRTANRALLLRKMLGLGNQIAARLVAALWIPHCGQLGPRQRLVLMKKAAPVFAGAALVFYIEIRTAGTAGSSLTTGRERHRAGPGAEMTVPAMMPAFSLSVIGWDLKVSPWRKRGVQRECYLRH